MLSNLLATPTYVSIPEVLLNAILGFIVVIVGIAFLIFVVWLVGLIMSKVSGIQTNSKKEKVALQEVEKELAVGMSEEEIPDEETIAVITASIMAYYQANNPKCEFVVKRIKKL